MDLGFGDANQTLGEATAKAILATTKAQEEAIDDKLAQYDALLQSNDDDTLEALRERRLAQLKQTQMQNQKYRDCGHGMYTALGEGQHGGDVAREFFDATKKSQRMVVHFYRPSTRLCDVFHHHLNKLAMKHLETRFVKINVESCDSSSGAGASYLVEKLGIIIMPTLLIVKNRKAVHHIRGFDELGGTEDFSTQALAYVLGQHGAITPRDDELDIPEEFLPKRGGGGVNSVNVRKAGSSRRAGIHDGPYDEDD